MSLSPKEQVSILMRGTKFADESTEFGDPGGASLLRKRCEEELLARIEKAAKEGRPLRVYLGVDPTRESLHIGHMVPAQKLRQFQELGHQAIFLIGDYTARIGDPTGQNKERAHIPGEEIDRMAAFYTDQAFKIMDKYNSKFPDVAMLKTEIRRNGEWLAPLDFEKLVEIAAIFPLKQIIARRDFQMRLDEGEGLRYHETLYALMQGYDAYMLKCDVQVGAYDQHFNLLAGRAIQEHYGDPPHIMLTMPLLAGTDGRKMSKTWGNTIDLLDTPEDMYGKCMRISDDLLPQYIELACDMSAADKDALLARLSGGENPMLVKKDVAWNVTRQYNGKEAAERAAGFFKATVQERRFVSEPPPNPMWSRSSLNLAVKIRKFDAAALAVLGETPKLMEAIRYYGLFKGSGRQLRTLFEQGAVKISGNKITDPYYLINELQQEESVLIQVGRSFCRIIK